MKLTGHLVFLAAMTFAVGAAAAQPNGERDHKDGPKSPVPPIVAAIDANHDGVISADEIQNAAARLKTLDKDGDGQLSREEYAGAQKTEFVDRFIDRFDKDKDGLVSKDELPGHLVRMLERGDGDKDGKLSRAEIELLTSKFSAGRRGSPSKKDNPTEKPPSDPNDGGSPKGKS